MLLGKVKRVVTGSTGLRCTIWGYRKGYPLRTASLYFSTHLLKLCEEVRERPSPKKNPQNKQRRAVFHTGIFSWEPHGSFCTSRALEYTHTKVFLILTISVSSELVNLNCLICYGICHGVWTKQSNRVVTGKCVLVGTLMCSLYIETRFDNVYVAHGLNGDVSMKEADCLAERRVETCHVCITDINVLCTQCF